MFQRRSLPDDVAAVREAHAPDAVVLDVEEDFETLPPAAAEDLGLLVDALDPAAYPDEWLPSDAPAPLRRYAGSDFTVGMPGDGTVSWTRQTAPPSVLVKRRASGTPEDFRDFLIAEALVQVGLAVDEHFLPFFGEQYPDLAAATPLGPADTYQLAAALHDAWIGLHTRAVFADWPAERPRLGAAWRDAGDRLIDRLDRLPGLVARGETAFAEAAEFACSAVKHDLDLPAPFAALDTAAYRDHGAAYAVRWAERTFDALRETDGTEGARDDSPARSADRADDESG